MKTMDLRKQKRYTVFAPIFSTGGCDVTKINKLIAYHKKQKWIIEPVMFTSDEIEDIRKELHANVDAFIDAMLRYYYGMRGR